MFSALLAQPTGSLGSSISYLLYQSTSLPINTTPDHEKNLYSGFPSYIQEKIDKSQVIFMVHVLSALCIGSVTVKVKCVVNTCEP